MTRLRLTLALALLASAVTAAYDYTGYRWAGTVMTYEVNLDSCTTPTLLRAAVLADVQAAAFAWTEQTNANFAFTYGGTTTRSGLVADGANTVFCTLDADGSGYLAETHSWAGGDGMLYDADIWLHLGNHPYNTSNQVCSVGIFVLDIMAHEFGHTLALNHASDLNATMYSPTSTCSTKERTLYTDDIVAIEAVYGVRVQPPPVPPPVSVCVTDGVTYPLGSLLPFTGNNGQANQWLTARQAEGWVLVSHDSSKGTSTLVVRCGLIDLHSVQVL